MYVLTNEHNRITMDNTIKHIVHITVNDNDRIVDRSINLTKLMNEMYNEPELLKAIENNPELNRLFNHIGLEIY